MAGMRIIKPMFFTDEEIAELPPLTRILFVGLWCHADRQGRLEDRPKRIKTEILPYDSHNVDAALTALHDAGFIIRFAVDAKKYIQINNFEKHQHCHVKEVPSTIPAPCQTGANPSLTVTEQEQNRTGTEDKTQKLRFVQPTLEQITSYCQERKNSVDPQKFFDYYTSNGWKVGKNSMKDWKAAVRTWEKNNDGLQNGSNPGPGRDFRSVHERNAETNERSRQAVRAYL